MKTLYLTLITMAFGYALWAQEWQVSGNDIYSTNTGNVGIGTTNPQSKLDINGLLTVGNIGDNSSITFFASNDKSAHIGVQDDNDQGFFIMTGNMYRMSVNQNGNVGIGTTTPDATLAVNGDIHTREVRVDMMGWPDFVFKKDYTLPTLDEVEAHIKANGHLKGIPNEAEVKANGINLGEMDAKLLQKIEELTLYTIEQQKRIEKLIKRIEILENK